MKNVSAMCNREIKVCESVRNGWYMSGLYRALVDEHERYFEADSPGILFNEVDGWFLSHERNHADSHLLVKCVEAR
jgi:hypothetical protein